MYPAKVKILVVDDDEEDKDLLREAFSELPLKKEDLLFAKNGQEAIELLEKLSPGSMPQLIVLDSYMPKMNGAETLEFLKNHDTYRQIPVIVYSGSCDNTIGQQWLSAGASNFIRKPFLFAEYCSMAKWLCEMAESKTLDNQVA